MKALIQKFGKLKTFVLLAVMPCSCAILGKASLAFPLSSVGWWGRLHTHALILLALVSLGFALVAVPVLAIGLCLQRRFGAAFVGVFAHVSTLVLGYWIMRLVWWAWLSG